MELLVPGYILAKHSESESVGQDCSPFSYLSIFQVKMKISGLKNNNKCRVGEC